MEDRFTIAFCRHKVNIPPLLLPIIFLSLGIRLYYSFHFFLSDEAFNLLAIEALADGKGFHPYFFKHPPLYILLSAFFCYLIGPYPQIPSYLSIFFSVISLVPFYFIANALMGKKIALWAAFFLSVMPANMFYSTWIKQDAMLLFFFLWGIDCYMNGRYKLAGLAAGIALLVKEFAFLFFPISLLITLINSRGMRRVDAWRGWLIMFLISSGISLWWYVLYGKMFYHIAGEALTGAYIVEWYWHYPWWFFLKNLPHDLSYPIFVLFLTGLAVIVREIYRKGASPGYSIPLAWLVVIYLPISCLYMKTPWFMFLATPALAIVAAFGLVKAANIMQSMVGNLLIYFLALASFIFLLSSSGHLKYNLKLTGEETRQVPLKLLKGTYGSSWADIISNKRSWEWRMRKINGRVGFLEYNPVFQYLMGLEEDRVVMIRVGRFMGLDREGLSRLVKDEGIGGFVLLAGSLTYSEKDLKNMESLWGMPEKFGPLIVFSTSDNLLYK